MNTFTRIPNKISAMFALSDVYTLTVMYLTAKYDEKHFCYVTDVTREQLAELTGLSLGYIKDEFLPRLKKSKFCKIEPFTKGYREKRNRYYLPDSKTNFRIINSRVTKDKGLTPKEKGFLISLFTICENNSLNCGLDEDIITSLMNISKTTFYRYKKRLVESKYIIPFDDIKLFDHLNNYCRGLEIKCEWIGSTSDTANDPFEYMYRKASTFTDGYRFNFPTTL